VYDIVRENQQRGVSKTDLEQKKDRIFNVANTSAKDRIKLAFILGGIAEKEGIKADQKEITQRILWLAQQYNISPEQMVKQVRERNGLAENEEQIISAKVFEYLELQPRVEDVLPGAGTPPG